jgi:flagellar L-ring protein FlgH
VKRALLLFLAAVSVLSSAQEGGEKSNPGSLYQQGTQNPFMDRVARRVGDIVTIVISEQSVSNFAAKTNATKSDSASFSPTFVVDIFNRLFRPFSASSNSSVKGDGDTSQTGSMSATMSAVVKEVQPNGNLVIEGTRTLVTNRQTQTFVLRGVIRPFDIKPDNTIQSSQIAEADIRMEGKGLIADRQRKGLLTTLLDWLF